jgi:hypothetical protein
VTRDNDEEEEENDDDDNNLLEFSWVYLPIKKNCQVICPS